MPAFESLVPQLSNTCPDTVTVVPELMTSGFELVPPDGVRVVPIPTNTVEPERLPPCHVTLASKSAPAVVETPP
jgi:hypothetical protein